MQEGHSHFPSSQSRTHNLKAFLWPFFKAGNRRETPFLHLKDKICFVPAALLEWNLGLCMFSLCPDPAHTGSQRRTWTHHEGSPLSPTFKSHTRILSCISTAIRGFFTQHWKCIDLIISLYIHFLIKALISHNFLNKCLYISFTIGS